jgi:hypothetical protein
VAADAVGANPGSYLSGVTLGALGALASDANTAARFDGTDDRVSMADPANGSLDLGTSDFTVEAWGKTSVNGERAFVSKRASSSGPYWQFTVSDDPGHQGEIRANVSAGSTREVYGPAIRVDDNAWHHVVVVYDRDAGITVYVDGVSRYFAGDLDEVAIYPHVLPAARVLAHLSAGRGS